MICREFWKKVIACSVIIVLSQLFFCLLNYSNINAALADDNMFQWEPIIKKSFDKCFAGNMIPFYDFYQYKGLDIFSTGYYGQLNPFMYMAYYISVYIFSYRVKILVIYIMLLYCLGNMSLYLLLTELKVSEKVKILSVFSYASSSFFFIYEFYYFTFNNYFFIPAFILVVLKCKKSILEWVAPGILLAASLLLGHVQYSVYYVMIYCIIQLIFCFQQRRIKPLGQLCVGVTLFFALNVFFLLSMINGAGTREFSGIDKSDFFRESLQIYDYFRVFKPFKSIGYSGVVTRDTYNDYVGLGISAYICLSILFTENNKNRINNIVENIVNGYTKKYKTINKQKEKYRKTILPLLILMITIRLLSDLLVSGSFYPRCIATLAQSVFAIIAYVLLHLSLPSFFRDNPKYAKYEEKVYRTVLWTLVIIILFYSIEIVLSRYVLAFIGLVVIGCWLFRIWRNNPKDACGLDNLNLIYALGFVLFFFAIFGNGEKYVVARLLYHVPKFNDFRFLYKCAFICIPLIVIISAFALENNIKTKSQKCYIFMCVGVLICDLLGSCNIISAINFHKHQYIANNESFDYFDYDTDAQAIEQRMEELNIDKNYRFLTCFLENPDIDYASKICSYCLTKNMSAYQSVYTIGGYDSLFSEESFEQSDRIMSDKYYEYHMSNMASSNMIHVFMESNDNNDVAVLHDQLVKNGVRYILYPTAEPDFYSNFALLVEKFPDVSIVRNVPWVKDYSLLELEGTRPICYVEGGDLWNINSEIDTIAFSTKCTDQMKLTISMTYHENLTLRLVSEDNEISVIKPQSDSDGYITAMIPAGKYDITLAYEDHFKIMAVIFACITTLVTMILIVALIIVKSKQKIKG